MPFVRNAAKLGAGCSITSDPTLSLKNARDQTLTFGAILSSDNWESFIQADASGSPPFAFGKELGFCAHAHTSGLQESRRIGCAHCFPFGQRFGLSSFGPWKGTHILCACAQIERAGKPPDRPRPSVSFLPPLWALLLPALERNPNFVRMRTFRACQKAAGSAAPIAFLQVRDSQFSVLRGMRISGSG